jgi:hypothetical protein
VVDSPQTDNIRKMVHWTTWHLIKDSPMFSVLEEGVAEAVEEEYL